MRCNVVRRKCVVVGGHTLGCSDMHWGWVTWVVVFRHGLGMVGHGLGMVGHGLGMVGHGLGMVGHGLGWADTGSPILFVRREALGDDCAWWGPLVTLAKR
jgi:hypothetical protein